MDNRNNNLQISHRRLIDTMKQLGYKSNDKGVCYGIVHMAKLAILAGNIKEFDQRLERIAKLSPAQLAWLANYNQHAEGGGAETTKFKIDPEMLDILAFFDGVELLFQPGLYPQYLPQEQQTTIQDADVVTPLIVNKKLEDEGKTIDAASTGVVNVKSFSGIYSFDEVKTYLESFAASIDEISPPVTRPLFLSIDHTDHTISVAYDAQQKHWIFINPNALPTQYFEHDETEKLASALFESFARKDKFASTPVLAFTTGIYGAHLEADRYTSSINAWYQKSQETIHKITAQKASMLDVNKTPLLYLAAQVGDVNTVKQLIEKGAKVNLLNAEDNSSLFIAVQNKHNEIVSLLLNHHADPNLSNHDGVTCLILAAMNNDVNIATVLIKHGADLQQVNEAGASALFMASQEGHLDMVQLLLKQSANVKQTNQAGVSALNVAVQEGHLDVVKLLLAHGADPNHKPNSGITSLDRAIAAGNGAMIDLLLQHGADVNAASKNGKTPLHRALESGDMLLVKSLIEKGAKVYTPDISGITPLDMAFEYLPQGQHEEIFKLMMSSMRHAYKDNPNVNITLKNSHFANLYHLALQVEDAELVKLLLKQSDLNINATATEQKLSPLILAIQMGNKDIAAMLLSHKKIDPSLPNAAGETPLMIALAENQPEIMQLLLNAGVTPFHQAVRDNNTNMIEKLLAAGLDINQKETEHGLTALHVAILNDKQEMVTLLLQHGAQVLIPSKEGMTPLDIALEGCFEGADPALITTMLTAFQQAYIKEPTTEIQLNNSRGWHLLHVACQCNLSSLVDLLIKHSAINVNATTIDDHNTPLMLAVINNNLSAAASLLAHHDINVNLADKDGDSPLYVAAMNNNIDMVRLLLAHNADIKADCISKDKKVLDTIMKVKETTFSHSKYSPTLFSSSQSQSQSVESVNNEPTPTIKNSPTSPNNK